jgi:micrococcal nuclease
MPGKFYRSIDALLLILMCFFLAGSVVLPDAVCHAEAPFFQAKVVRVIDGDTIEIQQKMKTQRVRIWGIDTPEWDQRYGAQSSQFTRSLVTEKDVQVVSKAVDKYGRLVAVIMMDNINVGEELIKSGLAWVHVYYCHEPICDRWKSLQESAKSEHRGVWNDSDPVAPWQWKKQHHQ